MRLFPPVPHGGTELFPTETKAKRKRDEDALQIAVVEFLRWALPDDALVFHIPNQGLRHRLALMRLVRMGLRAGIPDLQVLWRGRSLFVELKTPAGTASVVQRQMWLRLVQCGASVSCCRTVAQVEAMLRAAGVPLRASCNA